jgi:indole-3-acetate monooxygenase
MPKGKLAMSPITASTSVSSLLDAVHQIEPVIRAHTADAERERRLPDAVANAMYARGLHRLWRPRTFGGFEVDPITAFQVLEEVSRIDSAAGWNLQLATAFDAFGAWFPDDGAKEIFGQPDATLAGGFFPPRRAVSVDGGYRVTGQTPFASGAHQARWFMGLAQVYDGDTPRLTADGTPVTLMTICPANDAVIVDTWRTLGMRGTGSHDILMNDVFIPSRRAALLVPLEKPGSAYEGALYKLTVWQAYCLDRDIGLGDRPPWHCQSRHR